MSSLSQDTTSLIAASFYTRGLWSPILAWHRLTSSPYCPSTIEWASDTRFLRHHLRRAGLMAAAAAFVAILLLAAYVLTDLPVLGAIFVWWVLIVWIVLPWFGVRNVLGRPHSRVPPQGGPSDGRAGVLVVSDSGCINDLGYLLREAIFSIDTSKQIVDKPGTDAASSHGSEKQLTPALFYETVERAFDIHTNLWTQRVAVCHSDDVQPGSEAWAGSVNPAFSPMRRPSPTTLDRLLIVGQHPQLDGLAAVEYEMRPLEKHVVLGMRLRWLPPLKRRIASLPRLARQRLWWRVGVAPVLLAIVALPIWGIGVLEQSPATASGDGFYEIPYANVNEYSFPGDYYDGYDVDEEPWYRPDATTSWIDVVVGIAAVLFFAPLLLLAISIISRALSYLRGIAYGWTGTHLPAETGRCHRFSFSTRSIDDNESLRFGISCLQLIEEIVLNRTIDLLQDAGIDTSSLREEVRTFINQGIYMTGGNVRASNIIAGRGNVFSQIGFGKRANARRGKRALFSPNTVHA